MPPLTKKIAARHTTGKTLYAIIRQDSTNLLLNDADGAFAVEPVPDPYIALTEHATIKGLYERSEARTAWPDGEYTGAIYEQAGGSPSPAADTILSAGVIQIKSDAEVVATTVNVISAVSGSLNVDDVPDGGTLVIRKKATFSFGVTLNKDMTGKSIFFAMRKKGDTAYKIPNGGTTGKDVTADINLSTGNGIVTLSATETNIEQGEYDYAEIYSKPAGGGEVTPEQTYKILVRDHAASIEA